MKQFFKKYRLETFAVIAIALIIFIGWLFMPFQVPERDVNPAKSYEESVTRFEKIAATEKADPAYDQSCGSKLLSTGKKTDKVAVMYIGFTNCPLQMEKLGEDLKKNGYNVLILQAPHHGQKEKTNYDLGNITTKEIIDYGDESIDIAAGLGEKVTVVGLSVGGVVSSWVSQNRSEVVRAVNVAPIYTPFMVPGLIQSPAARIMNALPFVYIWWDPKNKENKVGSPYAYNGFPLDALGKYTEVANMFNIQVSKDNLKKVETVLVINENDFAINKLFARRMTFKVVKSNGEDVQIYDFAKEKQLDHDIIDPYNPKQKMSISYPVLIKLIIND